MGFAEIGNVNSSLTQRQRWGLYLTLIAGGVFFAIGVYLRNTALNATVTYSDIQAGIEIEYPANWLIDIDGDYIFRLRDMANRGFKTTIQVDTQIASEDTMDARNIFDALTLRRSQILAEYNVQSIEDYMLSDESMVNKMNYTFVVAETNPFLDDVPVVVQGTDILIIRQDQVTIATFQAGLEEFERNFPIFERILTDL